MSVLCSKRTYLDYNKNIYTNIVWININLFLFQRKDSRFICSMSIVFTLVWLCIGCRVIDFWSEDTLCLYVINHKYVLNLNVILITTQSQVVCFVLNLRLI